MIKLSAGAFRRVMTAAVVSASLAVTGLAQAAETYVFDKAHTQIQFSWDHFGVSRMSGLILDYEGSLTFDAAAPENSNLTINAKTDSLWTHVDKLTEHLKAEDFFNAAKFPEMTFTTTSVEKTGDTTGKITGDLTIKDVTKPVTFDVEMIFQGEHPFSKKPALGFRATTTIMRSEFDVGKFAPAVSDEIRIQIDTEMVQQES